MPAINPLLTRWGAAIDKNCPLADYPRPQLKRGNWRCLNGEWEYAICGGREVPDSAVCNEPERYDGTILVPFSPESLLSGVCRQLLPGQTLWYRRDVSFEKIEKGKRLLLHFGAVDQCCKVYINGSLAGRHEGGYWPFYFDITGLTVKGNNTLTVSVTDDSDCGTEAYGKQKLKRGGIWYTAQSGIWQTVWTEIVPEQYIESLKITPRYKDAEVEFSLHFALPDQSPSLPAARIGVYAGETLVFEGGVTSAAFRVPLPGFRPWSPDDPFLYTVKITAGYDDIESYFGMREFSVVMGDDGLPRPGLNGRPIFHSGLLDQGYWSDGLYTAPGDEAMVWELNEVKKLGFNMLRKHIKIESLRWYYHCDRLGILVWQDFVSGGGPYSNMVTQYLPFIGVRLRDDKGCRGFGRRNKDGRAVFKRDMARTVDLLHNVVSLAVWVPFNEGWGQFGARQICGELRAMDSTRLIDHASGWHDQGGGDFKSYHIYYKRFRIRKDLQNRVQALTEFGGYSCPSAGHTASDRLFGYRMFKNPKTFSDAFALLYRAEVIPAFGQGLSAAVYTQLSDVEDEINGLFTYDRSVLKADPETVWGINCELINVDKSPLSSYNAD